MRAFMISSDLKILDESSRFTYGHKACFFPNEYVFICCSMAFKVIFFVENMDVSYAEPN